MQKKSSRVHLPNDPAYISGVLAYCKDISIKAGFTDKEAEELCLALAEAAKNVMTHAFDPYDDEDFSITFDILEDGIKITIDEMGLPFSRREFAKDEHTTGLTTIKENVDDVVYINRGRDGKELQLFKYLTAVHVDKLLNAEELKPYDACTLPPKEMEYAIRPMLPEEAIDVSRCIYRSYKYTYLNADLYFPRRIEAMNRDGRMVSYVAVSGDGEIVGHFALEPRPNHKSSEIGVAVVAPSHRRRGLMRKLLTALITDAKSRGIINLYGNAFTMHTDSQRTNLKFDFFESALQLARLPVGSVTCMLENNLKGAGNVLTYFLYLSPPELYTVYLPPHHKEILREIYKKLGIERRFEDTGMAQPPELPIESELELTLKTEHMVATISVLSQGKDLEARVRAKMVELEDKGFNSIFIDLALKDPASPASVRTLEGAGFFFSGLLPDYSNGDVLRLQRYFTTVNYNEIECASDFATKLLEYVKGLDPRAKVKET